MTTCMVVYKSKIKSDRSIDKLKLRIVVSRDLQNKELVGDTWSPTAYVRPFEYFFEDTVMVKERMHQLDFIQAFVHETVKNRVFVKLYSRYADYFT